VIELPSCDRSLSNDVINDIGNVIHHDLSHASLGNSMRKSLFCCLVRFCQSASLDALDDDDSDETKCRSATSNR